MVTTLKESKKFYMGGGTKVEKVRWYTQLVEVAVTMLHT
jgi:hypothetical protein